jgi:hypothetical protein
MPRFVQTRAGIFGVGFLISGCWFDANYKSGQVTCDDGICPSNLVCVQGSCITHPPIDAFHVVTDTALDSPDATVPAALTCADPGTFVAGDTVTGTTVGQMNTVSALCNGTVMNGHDAVYKIAGTVGQMLTLTPHSSAYPITAYAIAPCTTSGVPSCTGNVYATDTTPVTITIPATTDYFILVDGGNAALSGAYSLTIALH